MQHFDPSLSEIYQVWASKAEGAKHNPPADIVWRAQANWGAGNKTITRLVSNSGEVRNHFHCLMIKTVLELISSIIDNGVQPLRCLVHTFALQ